MIIQLNPFVNSHISQGESRMYTCIRKNLKIILLISVLIAVIIWKAFFREEYVLDLHITIADIIQILVVIVALFNPIWVELEKRKEFGPKIKVNFNKETPYISQSEGWFVGSERERVFKIYLQLRNVGKTKMLSCEVVLENIKIYIQQNDKYVNTPKFFSTSVPWVGYKGDNDFRLQMDLNPEKDEIIFLGSLANFKDGVLLLSVKKRPSMEEYLLKPGRYIMNFKVLGENSEPEYFELKIVIFDRNLNNLNDAMNSIDIELREISV